MKKKLFAKVADALPPGTVLLVAGLTLLLQLHHSFENQCKLLLLLFIADTLKVNEVIGCMAPEGGAQCPYFPCKAVKNLRI